MNGFLDTRTGRALVALLIPFFIPFIVLFAAGALIIATLWAVFDWVWTGEMV